MNKMALEQLHAHLMDISAFNDKPLDEPNKMLSHLKILHEIVVNPKFSLTDLFGKSTFKESLQKSVQIVVKNPQHFHNLVTHLFEDIRNQLLSLDSPKSHFRKDIERLTTLNSSLITHPIQVLEHYETSLICCIRCVHPPEMKRSIIFSFRSGPSQIQMNLI